MRWISALFGTLLAAVLAVILFCIAYAGMHWFEFRSTQLFDALNSNLIGGLKLLWTEISQHGTTRRVGIATAIAFGAMIALMTMLFLALKKRQTTDARFLNLLEAKELGLTDRGGVFVGRIGGKIIKVPGSFSQRGSGRKSKWKPKLVSGQKLWIDGDDVGGFVIGPPRSGKGASLIVPNCLLWPDSLIVLDMRGETYEATAGYRQKFSHVVRFSPADEKGETEKYNPLDFVSINPDQRDIDINSIAAALLPTPKNDAYWIQDGRALFSGVVSWVLENPEVAPSDKNIGTVLRIIEGTELSLRDWLLKEAGAGKGKHGDWIGYFTRSCLARFAVMADKQFDGVYGTLAAAVKPFKNERILRATATSTFDIRAMRHENISLYLDFRIQQVASIGPIFNVLMTQFMDYMSRDMMQRHEKRVLVLLDEFQNLGKLENALTVATVLGGYGIPTWFFVQSLRSIDNVYTREGRQTLVNAARAQIFFGAQDPEDQRYVSQLLGERTDTVVDVSHSGTMFDQKRTSVQSKHVMRPLMRPDEIGSMDETRCIIKIRNQRPILGLRNFYYADKELSVRAWLPIKISKSPFPASRPRLAQSDVIALSETLADLPRVMVKPSIEPGSRFSELAKPLARTESQTALEKLGGDSAIDKPNFGVLADAINLEPTLTSIDVEALSDLLPDGEAANAIAALIASDIEFVLSE
jgi:type IV secretion system protein VirD4